jgi:hypothetical protein
MLLFLVSSILVVGGAVVPIRFILGVVIGLLGIFLMLHKYWPGWLCPM